MAKHYHVVERRPSGEVGRVFQTKEKAQAAMREMAYGAHAQGEQVIGRAVLGWMVVGSTPVVLTSCEQFECLHRQEMVEMIQGMVQKAQGR